MYVNIIKFPAALFKKKATAFLKKATAFLKKATAFLKMVIVPNKIATALLVLSVLSGCASTVTVTGKIPPPLVPQLPLNVKLIYTDEFKRYNYEEEEKGRGLRSIAFGEAQVTLFDGIFSNLLNLVDADNNEIDIQVTPALLDFQYSAPRETRVNLYEIWLKYRVRITDANDKEIADWVVKGYGKTPTALLNTASQAFDSATNVALRDVGAQLAIGFQTQPEIKDFLDNRSNFTASQPNANNSGLNNISDPSSPERDKSSLERDNSNQYWRIK